MVVLDPLRVVITNFPAASNIQIEVPDFPADPNSKKHTVPFGPEIFIEHDDFRQVCIFHPIVYQTFNLDQLIHILPFFSSFFPPLPITGS